MQTGRSFLDRIVNISIIAAAVAVVWLVVQNQLARRPAPGSAQRRELAPPVDPISIDGAVSRLGALDAAVALIVYSDFQCPYCRRFSEDTLPTLLDHYVRPGKILVVFRHFPLPNHPFATRAAEFAQCAGREGKFWEMHDSLFEDASNLSERAMLTRATKIGLNLTLLKACLDDPRVSEEVSADLAQAKRLGVSLTPTFFLGKVGADRRVTVVQALQGALPLARFREAIDKLMPFAQQ